MMSQETDISPSKEGFPPSSQGVNPVMALNPQQGETCAGGSAQAAVKSHPSAPLLCFPLPELIDSPVALH